jgi:hypothetical protein
MICIAKFLRHARAGAGCPGRTRLETPAEDTPADKLGRVRGPQTSRALSLAEALQSHATLGALLGSWRTAQECMQVARPTLGPGLATLVRPGPLQEGRWVLLADNGTAASKARQLLPRVQAALQAKGLPVSEVQVRVSPRK